MATATHLGPSSSSLERDARRIHGDKPVSPGSIAIGVVIGRMSEFFDFFVYGLASVLVFPQLVFPFAPDRVREPTDDELFGAYRRKHGV